MTKEEVDMAISSAKEAQNQWKKKGLNEIDIKPHILKSKVADYNDYIKCKVLLPAGSTTNINPTLIINAYNKKYNADVFYQITRLDIFDKDGNSFK